MRVLVFLLLACMATFAQAGVFTMTSPLNGGTSLVGTGVTEVGGIVFQARGLNGATLTSQLSASSLFTGFAGTNPLTIGTQSGYTNALLSQLGGGFNEIAVRVTLSDGDTGNGDFDFNQNFLQINGFGNLNFSTVQTIFTNGIGVEFGGVNLGFRDSSLDTGFFRMTNATDLSNVYNNLFSTGVLSFQLNDLDQGDNFFDFTQGVNGSLIGVGSGPQVGGGTVPEPSSFAIFCLAGLAVVKLRRKRS